MSALSLLRPLRRSRWRTLLATSAIALGALVGPLASTPADAHGNGVHYVTITGWVQVTEPSGNTAHPLRCTRSYSATLTLQRGKKTADRIDLVNDCWDDKASIVFNARLRDDKYVDAFGNIQFKDYVCYGLGICWYTSPSKKDFFASIPEDFTQTMPNPEQIGAPGVTANFKFNIIVDGPDDPVM